MKHQFTTLALLVLMPIGLTLAQQPSKNKAIDLNDVGAIHKTIDNLFQNLNGQTPGVAVSILKDGKMIVKKAYGMANIEHSVPFSHQTPVRLGYSGSREFMCVGLAIMEAEGLLQFDDKVQKYFPQLPSWSAGVTIQDLLNHSSGFDDEWATLLLMHANMNNRVDKEQLLRLLYRQPKPQVEPGKGYMYSNTDFALLRYIMEIASKKSLPVYLKEKLFSPLNMSATFMNDNLQQLIPGFAENYEGNGWYTKLSPPKTSPGGNYRIVTTATDLEKWALAVADTTSIVGQSFTRLYKNARIIPVLKPERHFVFGHEWITPNKTDVVKHGGVNHDFYMFRVPAKNVTVIGLGNSINSMATAMQLVDSLLPENKEAKNMAPQFPDTPVVLQKTILATYAGRYYEKASNTHSSHLPKIRFFDIKEEDGQLNFYFTAEESFPMVPFGNNLFKDTTYNVPIQFIQPHPDSAKHLKAWTPDGKLLELVQQKSKLDATPVYLQQFTGQFYSSQLDYYCSVILSDNGQLVLIRPTVSDALLQPFDENRFLFEMEAGEDSWNVLAAFTKNGKGEITGIDMQHIRMMHHRFDKL